MTNLLELKENLRSIYSKYDIYITPFFKFLLAICSLGLINGNLGYMSRLNSIPLVLVLSLMCSFLPMNVMILISAAFIVIHLYALSLECAIVTLAVFVVLFLLYFRFSPKDTLVVMLLPICFGIKIPLVIPIAMGLIGTPVSILSVSSGVVVYYILKHISDSVQTLNKTDADNAMQKYRYMVDGILSNKEMLVTILAFAIALLIVYMIRRLSVDHAWTIAIVVGIIASVVVSLIGDLIFDTQIDIRITILGAVISFFIIKLLQFMVFNVDYSRTEFVQFEDDEYYYYVKAVPKIMVSKPEKTVKKINTQNHRPSHITEEDVEEVRRSIRRSRE